MTEAELFDVVRRLRGEGRSLKEIAHFTSGTHGKYEAARIGE